MSMPTEKEARQFMYDCLVYNTIDFGHEWAGWKMRGRVLVSPDGDRISAQRLRGLLFQFGRGNASLAGRLVVGEIPGPIGMNLFATLLKYV